MNDNSGVRELRTHNNEKVPSRGTCLFKIPLGHEAEIFRFHKYKLRHSVTLLTHVMASS